ncbi:MAG: helix-turn-helix domain-containing protein [Clostridia bacterium]
MINKNDIIKVAIKYIEEKSIDFTILDVAKILKTSKRTIYQSFVSKNALIAEAIEYIFTDIKLQHYEILKQDINSLEKLYNILLVYPRVVNFDKISLNKIVQNYPNIYAQIDKQLAGNWELTLEVFNQCKSEGFVDTQVNNDEFRLIMLGIYEQSLNFPNHQEMLKKSLHIVFNGIKQK